MCADTEQELNKWVTGIRVAKYGKQLFTNYRGIVEEMAHDDLDQLASSRFSADPKVELKLHDLKVAVGYPNETQSFFQIRDRSVIVISKKDYPILYCSFLA